MDNLKEQVKGFWEEGSCGENLYLQAATAEGFRRQSEMRYKLEPYIEKFANFAAYKAKKILEIGLGLGADHQRFAEAGAEVFGVDLTQRSVDFVSDRFKLYGLTSHLNRGDAEALEYPDNFFDLVYSWGVIHHSPNTQLAAEEILRVLKPGGEFKVMVYYKYSLVGFMLWLRYALLRGRPFVSLQQIYSQHLESPGTKAYTVKEAKALFAAADIISTEVELTHADLLSSAAGQKHRGKALSLARKIWPRFLIKTFFKRNGLFLLIHGRKHKGTI